MHPIEKFLDRADEIEGKLGVRFQNRDLLVLAFTHRSFLNENRDLASEHNERLEFLGDSILNLLAAEHLFLEHPDMPEGELSRLRAQLVQGAACTQYIDALDVGAYVLLGRGEQISGRGRESINANLFEAILGAIFLDQGLEAARTFFLRQKLTEVERNWKAELQDYTQKTAQLTPVYEVVDESGPDHAKCFVVEVKVDGKVIGRGEGESKKAAQQQAAKDAMGRYT